MDFGPNVEVIIDVLPVDFAKIEGAMQKLDDFKPDYIIGMGKAQLSDHPQMRFEQGANSISHYGLLTHIPGHEPHIKRKG